LFLFIYDLYGPDARGVVDPEKMAGALMEMMDCSSSDVRVVESLKAMQMSVNGMPQEIDKESFIKLIRNKAIIGKSVRVVVVGGAGGRRG